MKIGYKKVSIYGWSGRVGIAILEITGKVVRSRNPSGYYNKRRTSSARVLLIIEFNESTGDLLGTVKIGYSMREHSFKYRVGKTVKPWVSLNENRYEDCGSGIHYFPDIQSAMEYTG